MKQSPEPKSRRKFSLRGENSTVLLITVFFFISIVLIQLISSAVAGNVTYPSFLSPVNLLNIMMQVAAVGIMATGMSVVMIGGGIDLSVGMLVSLVSLYFAKSFMDWDFPLAAAIGSIVVIAVLLETAMGWIISRFKVEPFIITLGGMIAFRGIALLICRSQEVSTQGILDPLKANLIEGARSPSGLNLNFPIYVVVFLTVTVIMWWLLKYTKYGRRVYAVGANREAAYLAGIGVKNVMMSTYALNGFLVSIAAFMLLARVNTAIITIGQNLEIDVIAATVVGGVALSGGKGNIWGTFIGAILLGTIANAMNILRLQSEWQYVAKGVIIIAAVSAGAIVQARNQKAKQLR